MKAPAFDYQAPRSLEEALALVGEFGDEARFLAGGQSLVPLMNLRLARPAVVIDLNRIDDLSYIVAADCGRIINPMIVDGQIQGGVAHGISDCLYENLQYDEEGQLLTASYLTYLLPTACDVPPVHVNHIEIPSSLNPIGVRGAGEFGTIGVPAAIANAIEDALSPFGAQIREFPLTQDRIWGLIAAATSPASDTDAGVSG